jgi:hypothetical protein
MSVTVAVVTAAGMTVGARLAVVTAAGVTVGAGVAFVGQ